MRLAMLLVEDPAQMWATSARSAFLFALTVLVIIIAAIWWLRRD
jgi:L-lactate permease